MDVPIAAPADDRVPIGEAANDDELVHRSLLTDSGKSGEPRLAKGS